MRDPVMLILGVMKLSRFVYSILIFKHHLIQNILTTWQVDWNSVHMNKFHSAKLVLISSTLTGSVGVMKLSCVRLALVRLTHIWLIHTSWRKILYLRVLTVSVLWQFNLDWWSAIILCKRKDIFDKKKCSGIV